MNAPRSDTFIASFDIGSSAVKAVLVSRDGQMQLAHTVSYRSAAVHCEQDPQDWWLAFCQVLQKWWEQGVLPSNIAALTFSGQMQSLIALDAHGHVLCPAWLHTDARASDAAARITEQMGADAIHRVTRNPFNATSVLPKLLHLREHHADVWERTAHVLVGAKDFITQRLTGRAVTDPTTAATTGMFDIEHGAWAHQWLDSLGLKRALPDLLNADAQVGVVSTQAAAITGLAAGCPVLCGLGDAAATTLGAGVSDASQCYAYLGTSAWVARVSDVSDSATEQFNAPGAPLFVLPYLPPAANGLPRRIFIGPISNAGAVHRWALRWLDAPADAADAADTQRYALFEHAVAAAPFDPKLMFLPYLNGERLPVNSSEGQGAIVGLGMDTSRAQMMRAALEGVSLSLRWALDMLQPQGTRQRELIVVGGATRSAEWMQILADCFDAPLHIPAGADLLPCLGAAAIAARAGAGAALDWCASPEDFVRRHQSLSSNSRSQTVLPRPEAAAQMQAKSRRWRALQAAVSTLSDAPR